MANVRSGWTLKRVGAITVMVLGAALIGYGTHYLALSGTCSSTGYSSVGPVPKCPSGEAFYIVATFFLGPFLTIAGYLFARMFGNGILWPLVCLSLFAGLTSLVVDPSATTGVQSFGRVVGVVFLLLAGLSVSMTLRKRLRRGAVGPADVVMPSQVSVAPSPVRSSVAPSSPPPGQPAGPTPQRGTSDPATAQAQDELATPAGPPSGLASDPLERIARLAQLRDSGALTQDEFEREKAKLLAQM